jgi:ribosomal protein S18 acetylase RimI-like enzyme
VPSAASGGGRRSDIGHRTSDIGRLPSRCHLKIPPEHEAAFAAGFEILERDHMLVMALDRCDYRPATSQHDVRRLDASSPVAPILDVYRSYPGHFFEPGQLSSGIHFGSFECDRLVAVAGTHVYSPAGRVAAVGNIVTASDARGRGHAAACTSAVIEAVYERGCETIVLHVAATNAPALACYRRLGFHDHGPILQLRGSESG